MTAEKWLRRSDEIISMKTKLLLNPNMLQKLLHSRNRQKGIASSMLTFLESYNRFTHVVKATARQGCLSELHSSALVPPAHSSLSVQCEHYLKIVKLPLICVKITQCFSFVVFFPERLEPS